MFDNEYETPLDWHVRTSLPNDDDDFDPEALETLEKINPPVRDDTLRGLS